MADTTRLKRKSSLGAPPPVTEASTNLEAPETAPTASAISSVMPSDSAPSRRMQQDGKHDGRSARRTGRTLQFATRVSVEFDERLRTISARDGLLLVEVLERALDAYEASRSSGKKVLRT